MIFKHVFFPVCLIVSSIKIILVPKYWYFQNENLIRFWALCLQNVEKCIKSENNRVVIWEDLEWNMEGANEVKFGTKGCINKPCVCAKF